MKNSGVYSLWLSGRCVYVGKAVDLARRERDHRRRGIVFDEMRFSLVASEACRRSIEAAAIRYMKPLKNKQRLKARAMPEKSSVWGTFSSWQV